MFRKGSRYRRVPEIPVETIKGEPVLSKGLRILAERPQGRFLHTVQEGDRLDLLAYKYYGDATKWWQIGDANPEPSFPLELLDRRPLARERLVLAYTAFQARFTSLVEALAAYGTVTMEQSTAFEETIPRTPDYVESMLVVEYPPSTATRKAIMQHIRDRGFQCIRKLAWESGAQTAEAFTFVDAEARENWRVITMRLSNTAGVMEVRSLAAEKTLELRYNSAMIDQKRILMLIQASGFVPLPESQITTATGTQIVMPPNQIA